MKLLAIIAGLAATASAIDIRSFSQTGCRGSYVRCLNAQPNVCCTTGSVNFVSAALAAIPPEWRVEFRTYQGGGCNTLRSRQGSGGSRTVCISENDGLSRISGASYVFTPIRRSAVAAGDSSQECAKPDTLVLEDESAAFAITDMEEPLLKDLMEYAFNGTQAADIPQMYEPYKIDT